MTRLRSVALAAVALHLAALVLVATCQEDSGNRPDAPRRSPGPGAGGAQLASLEPNDLLEAFFQDIDVARLCAPPVMAGVECDCPLRTAGGPQCDVTALLLSGRDLSGPLPANLSSLGALQELDLSRNSFSGAIPPQWFAPGAFGALRTLNLSNNQLSGTLPSRNESLPALGLQPGGASEAALPVLGSFDVERNSLSGTLPGDLLGSGSVAELRAGFNQLSGTLPGEWASTPAAPAALKLRVLLLNDNRLSGTLPVEWRNFAVLDTMQLQNNDLQGPVPGSWIKSIDTAPHRLGVWPGNPRLCGPVWGAEADVGGGSWATQQLGDGGSGRPEGGDSSSWEGPRAPLAYMAALFPEQATWGPRIANETIAGAGGAPMLHLTNTLGSCAAPCDPPLTYNQSYDNLFDLSWREGVGLNALLRANPERLRNGARDVLQPCWPRNDPKTDPYLGGDLAFGQAAFASQAPINRSRLLEVASVVASTPGEPLTWNGSFVTDAQEDSFWAVDLGASVEVAVILATPGTPSPGGPAGRSAMVYVGDNSTSVEFNLCRLPLAVEGPSPLVLPMPPGCQGRYIIFSGGNVSLRNVQVYPTLADAGFGKPVLLSSDASSSDDTTDGNPESCVRLQRSAGEDAEESWAALDLQYEATVAAVTVYSRGPGNATVLLTNSTTQAADPVATCEMSLQPLPETDLFQGACALSGSARYVMFEATEAGLDLCEVGAYLAQPPSAAQQAEGSEHSSEDGEHSHVGVIVGATIGGLLGAAAVASCLACGWSYRAWRRTQRQHSQLAKELALAQGVGGGSGGVESKDGLVAAAALEAMVRGSPPKSELQLLSTYLGMRLRRLHDSAGSCLCCPAGAGAEGAGSATDSGASRRMLLPLFYLSGGRRKGAAAARGTAGLPGDSSLDTATSSATGAGPSPFDRASDDPAQPPRQAEAPLAVQLSTQLSTALGGLVDYSDIQLGKYLGDGSFGSVHLARWKHVQVAVKVLQRIDPKLLHAGSAGLGSKVTRSGRIAEQTLKELGKEAGIMASLRHPCIVSYIGACLEPPCLVMEYCARGSVYGVLSGAVEDRAAAAVLTWPRLLRFAWDAAKGMLYLHTLRPPVMHRDLKSANLLVDANWHVKVSDFNLSRVLEPAGNISTLSTANPRWMAPEVIRGQVPTLAADVFSFGVVLHELMTWNLPWGAELNPFQIANLVLAGSRLDVPPPEELPPGPLLVYDEYVALMHACWADDPAARPTFESIVQTLQTLTTRVVQASRKALV